MQLAEEIVADRLAKIRADREASQPLRTKTGGSTFKNPPGAKAWELIDQAGCRGLVHGGAKDGRVSVIPSSAGVYSDAGGKHSFLLISIVNNMFDAQPNDFPRIDKHPSCPAALKGVVAEKCKL